MKCNDFAALATDTPIPCRGHHSDAGFQLGLGGPGWLYTAFVGPVRASRKCYSNVPQRVVWKKLALELENTGNLLTPTPNPVDSRMPFPESSPEQPTTPRSPVEQQSDRNRETPMTRVRGYVLAAVAPFATSELATSVGISPSYAVTLLEKLVATGDLIRLPERGKAWVRPEVAAALDAPGITIERLRDLARRSTRVQVSPPRRGRVTLEERRRRSSLTVGQLRDVETALRQLGSLKNLRETDPIPPSILGYDIGTDRWELLNALDLDYVTYRKNLGKRRGGGQVVNAKSVAAARAKLATSLGLVLDLAANAGLVRRAAVNCELSPEWILWLPSTSEGKRRHRVNARCLAREAVAAGMYDPRLVDWERLGRRLRRPFVDPQDKSSRQNAISAFRFLGKPGLPPPASGPGSRQALFSSEAIRDAARGDWASWCASGLTGLVNGRGGLRDWQIWVTTTSRLALDDARLPDHQGHPDPEGRTKRGTSHVLRPSTVRGNLRMLARVLAKVKERDGQGALDELTPAELGEKRVTSAASQLEAQSVRAGAFASLARFLGFTARVAQFDNLDTSQALRRRSMLLAGAEEHPPVDEKRRAQATVNAWGGRDVAYAKAQTLRDELACLAEVEVGLPIAEQLLRARAGDSGWQGFSWAQAVRDAMMMGLLLRIPLRRSTLAGLRLWPANDPEIAKETSVWVGGTAAAPWGGGIQLHCPPRAMKADQGFHPWLVKRRSLDSHDPIAEASLRRDIIELYLGPTGARAWLVGNEPDDGWLWIGEGGERLLNTSLPLSRRFSEFAPILDIDVEALRLAGCRGAHSFRHLYGTQFAPIDLMFTSKMMHHASTQTTERVYCAFDEKDCDFDSIISG